MKKLIFLLSILLLGKAFSQDSVKSDYLPLSSGNTWQYFGYNYTGNLTPNVYYYATDISSVQKKVTVGLDTFYLLNNDTLRYDKAEDVIYSPASVYMDFTRAAGYSYPGDGISKTTVITGNYSFLDSTYQCKGFERTFDDMLHATDNSCYFARSLGPVHKYSNSRNMGGYVYGSSMGLIMAIIKDSAGNFVSFTKHYKPAISVTPLLKTGSSVFNLDITIRHKYQQISGVFVDSIWGLVNNITGNNFIDSALFESFYSLKDSIQKCPPMLLMGTIPETNYTVSTAIDTVLMKKGFTFNYRQRILSMRVAGLGFGY
jgi:hypothetical protein